MFRIKGNRGSELRTEIFIEDVKFDVNIEFLYELGMITKITREFGQFLIFKEPYRIPKFNKFFASGIKSISDPYLFEAFDRLLYMNPNPSIIILKKIVEYIVMKLSKHEQVESDIKLGKMTYKSVLNFEEVQAALQGYMYTGKYKNYIPDTESSVLFSKDCILDRGEKISILAQVRSEAVREHLEKAIHTVAEHLIDTQVPVKVTHTRIEGTKMIKTSKGAASVRTIRKFMSARTKRIVDEHNEAVYFKTEKSYQKFKEFLELPDYLSLNQAAAALGVSKSTVVGYNSVIINN